MSGERFDDDLARDPNGLPDPDGWGSEFDRDLVESDERLADYVDDRLSDRDRERFDAELRVSPRLREQPVQYQRTVAAVQLALRAPTQPTLLADRVMARLASEAARPSLVRRKLRPFLFAAASAAALLALAVLVDRLGGPELSQRDDFASAPPIAAHGQPEARPQPEPRAEDRPLGELLAPAERREPVGNDASAELPEGAVLLRLDPPATGSEEPTARAEGAPSAASAAVEELELESRADAAKKPDADKKAVDEAAKSKAGQVAEQPRLRGGRRVTPAPSTQQDQEQAKQARSDALPGVGGAGGGGLPKPGEVRHDEAVVPGAISPTAGPATAGPGGPARPGSQVPGAGAPAAPGAPTAGLLPRAGAGGSTPTPGDIVTVDRQAANDDQRLGAGKAGDRDPAGDDGKHVTGRESDAAPGWAVREAAPTPKPRSADGGAGPRVAAPGERGLRLPVVTIELVVETGEPLRERQQALPEANEADGLVAFVLREISAVAPEVQAKVDDSGSSGAFAPRRLGALQLQPLAVASIPFVSAGGALATADVMGRDWLVRGSRAELERLMREVARHAASHGGRLVTGEIGVIGAHGETPSDATSDATSADEVGSPAGAEPPRQIVLRFRRR